MSSGDKAYKRLMGLEEGQERVFLVRVGNSEVIFKDQHQAIEAYKALSILNPFMQQQESLSEYSSGNEDIKEDIQKIDFESRYVYFFTPSQVILESKVVNVVKNREEAKEAIKKMESDIREAKKQRG